LLLYDDEANCKFHSNPNFRHLKWDTSKFLKAVPQEFKVLLIILGYTLI